MSTLPTNNCWSELFPWVGCISAIFLFCLETEKKQKSSRPTPIAPHVWAGQRVNTLMDIPCGN